MNGIFTRYNEQKNCIDVTVYDAGYILRIDCGKWEDGIITTMNSQGRMDTLAIDDPLEYVRLALDEEMQLWADAIDDDSIWWLEDYKIDFVLECSPWNFHGETNFWWGISNEKRKSMRNLCGIKNRVFKCIFYRIFSMGKIHRVMNFPWGISNEKFLFMGNFHGEYKILGVLGELTPLTGGKSQRWLSCVSCHVGGSVLFARKETWMKK